MFWGEQPGVASIGVASGNLLSPERRNRPVSLRVVLSIASRCATKDAGWLIRSNRNLRKKFVNWVTLRLQVRDLARANRVLPGVRLELSATTRGADLLASYLAHGTISISRACSVRDAKGSISLSAERPLTRRVSQASTADF